MLAYSLVVRHQLQHGQAPWSGKVSAITLLAFGAIYIGVIAHEGAHALTGWAVGRKTTGVTVEPKLRGGTSHEGPEKGLGRVMTSFAGYLGPSLFGLAAASLIARGYGKVVLPSALFLLLILLFLVRNIFGAVAVLATGALLALILHYGTDKAQHVAAYGLSWVLLLFGVGSVLMHRTKAKDAENLHGLTRVRPSVWVTLWLAGTVVALWAGVRLLT